nr:hypothetical protein [Tanacetum cinerariifolium]GEW77364.1 hypothetical protein [Tanacetum cinerariifolium]GEW79589.1 hypothetical protein [Tanacetum cinerariifolium]
MEESLPKMIDDRVKELTKIQVPVYVANGLIMKRKQSQPDVTKMIADAIQQEHKNFQVEISSQINNAITNHIPSQDDLTIWLALKYKSERLYVSDTPCRPFSIRPRDQDDPHDDAHPKGKNFGGSSSGQANESKSGIEKYKMFFIISKPVYGIVYKNTKKEKRVMRHQEVYKLYDATLKRVLEGLKSYNNDVKHGYVTSSLSKEDVEYLRLFEEEIKEWLKHHDQMRHWDMYVNGRPLGSRRERPE